MDSIVRVITVMMMMMKVILMKMVIMISIVITLSLSFSGSLPYKDCSPEQQEDNQDCMRGRVQYVY